MNKKVVFGLLGLAAAGGIAYYFWQKNASSGQIATGSSTPNNNNAIASGGFTTALPQNTSTSTPVTPCKYVEGQLLRAKDKVYYVDGACVKHWVQGNIYSKYGFKGGDIKGISQAELDAIPEGDALQGIAGLAGNYLMWE